MRFIILIFFGRPLEYSVFLWMIHAITLILAFLNGMGRIALEFLVMFLRLIWKVLETHRYFFFLNPL